MSEHSCEVTAEEAAVNLAVRFYPQNPADDEGDEFPCMEVGTLQVYGYRAGGRLVLSVESGGVDSAGSETEPDGNVPMVVTVYGRVVFEQ